MALPLPLHFYILFTIKMCCPTCNSLAQCGPHSPKISTYLLRKVRVLVNLSTVRLLWICFRSKV